MIIQKIQVLRDKCLETGGGVSVWDCHTSAEDDYGAADADAPALADTHACLEVSGSGADACAPATAEAFADGVNVDVYSTDAQACAEADAHVATDCWADADAELERPPT